MDHDYLLKMILFYFVLTALLTANRFFGGSVTAEFQFFTNVALLLIAAASIIAMLIRQYKAPHVEDKKASAAAKAEHLEEIAKHFRR